MSRRLSPYLSSRARLLFLAVSLTSPLALFGQALSPTPSQWAERIDHAIRTGRDALVPRLDPLVEDPRSDYPIGRIAFVLSALLESGVPTRLPTVRRALDKLSRLKPTKTYCVAGYLLVLGALLDRLADDRGTDAGSSHEQGAEADEPAAARLTEVTIRTRMEELAAWLVNARTKGRGTWTYEVADRSRKHDFSNTQFAVLGLHVAMKHGIPIPSEVFAEIIRSFSGAIQLEKAPVTLTYRPAMRFEAMIGLEARPKDRRMRVRPGGWAYRSVRSTGKPAYAAMTAAGASSVVVALKALRRSTGGRWQRVTVLGEKTLHRSYAWIETHFEDFLADGRNLCYTLYSLEKVGDLGEIASFGEHDWYLEGARRLLDKQRKNGSWGGYVDTAFALLYLTRATRSMHAAAAPTFVTSGGKGDEARGKGDAARTGEIDLVYIDRAKGFLSARDLMQYMAETRDPRLVDIGKEIVRNYDPRHKENLIPHLLVLWKEPGRLRTFARRALKDITGESFKASRDAHRWYREFLAISDLEESPTVNATEVARKLRAVESPVLKTRLVRLARRRELRDLAQELVEELTRSSRLRTTAASSYRRTIHGLLDLWTGGEIPMPADNDVRAWEKTAREWKRWLRENE